MKKSIAVFILTAVGFAAQASKITPQGDSLIVQFGNNTRLIIQAKDKAGILSLKQYDLNKIVRDMGATLDSSDKETYIYINEQNGRKYLKDTVLVVTRKDGEVKITVNEPSVQSKESEKEEKHEYKNNDDDGKITRNVTRRYRSPRNGFDVLVGLNTYAKNDPLKYTGSEYDLLPWGSRFVSLSWVRGAAISRGKDASLGLDLGVDVAWYNLMFDGNNTVRKDANAISFPVNANDLYKSKLTAAYLNLSLMPTLAVHHGPISYLSFGMYAGYRLDSYTKVQEARKGRSDRTHSNFYMNNFRYGIGAELGIRHFPDLFMQYDMGELFESNKGPAVRMISFGIRL
ncbi:MAG: outer membrane beta-barrel protein [Spirosomataceae bacterium]